MAIDEADLVRADAAKLRRVIHNLLSNAIKVRSVFGPPGRRPSSHPGSHQPFLRHPGPCLASNNVARDVSLFSFSPPHSLARSLSASQTPT